MKPSAGGATQSVQRARRFANRAAAAGDRRPTYNVFSEVDSSVAAQRVNGLALPASHGTAERRSYLISKTFSDGSATSVVNIVQAITQFEAHRPCSSHAVGGVNETSRPQ